MFRNNVLFLVALMLICFASLSFAGQDYIVKYLQNSLVYPPNKILPSDGEAGDLFGFSVSIWDSFAVVGAYRSDEEVGDDAGSAYVFKFDGIQWVEAQKLLPTDGTDGDKFGTSVDIFGDYIIVGAEAKDSGKGAAYIFKNEQGIWIQQAKLVGDTIQAGNFGHSVSIYENLVIVGAFMESIGGNLWAGAAYVYEGDGDNWIQKARLTSPVPDTIGTFGLSVAITNNYAFISSPGDVTNNSSPVYVFEYQGGDWVEQTTLFAADGERNDNFGVSICVDDDVLVIGANGDTNENGNSAGAVYIFNLQEGEWSQTQKLLATDGTEGDEFGLAVSIYDTSIVIGAPSDKTNGTNSGSAYVFKYRDANWVQDRKLKAKDRAPQDYFGRAVGIAEDYAIVGAYQNDDLGVNSGSAYMYKDEPDTESVYIYDMDGDGDVDIIDVQVMIDHLGLSPNDPDFTKFNVSAVGTSESSIDMKDVKLIIINWGYNGE